MTDEPAVFDSNIYLYSFDNLSPKFDLAKNLVERAVSGKLEILIIATANQKRVFDSL